MKFLTSLFSLPIVLVICHRILQEVLCHDGCQGSNKNDELKLTLLDPYCVDNTYSIVFSSSLFSCQSYHLAHVRCTKQLETDALNVSSQSTTNANVYSPSSHLMKVPCKGAATGLTLRTRRSGPC